MTPRQKQELEARGEARSHIERSQLRCRDAMLLSIGSDSVLKTTGMMCKHTALTGTAFPDASFRPSGFLEIRADSLLEQLTKSLEASEASEAESEAAIDPEATGREVAPTPPEISSADPEVATTDPNVASTDPEIASIDPEIASTDPEVASTDPKVASADPEAAPSAMSDAQFLQTMIASLNQRLLDADKEKSIGNRDEI
ncbi:hypothetical protein BGZ73_006145 [Actinomortierella ambigua]|nr:hypothetical protein BGZ73_006145 [Actinomortierella ambigua]